MSCQRKKPLTQFARRTPLFCGLKEECVFVCSASAREWGEEKKGIFLKYAQRCKRFKANISTGLDTSFLFFCDTLISLLCPVVWKKQTPHCPLVVLNGTWDLFGLELLSVNVYPEKKYIYLKMRLNSEFIYWIAAECNCRDQRFCWIEIAPQGELMGQYKSQESRISKHRQEISRDIQWSPKETTLKIYDFYFHSQEI